MADGRRGEIDALVRIDDTLLVVEAKAGATRLDSELTDAERFRETLTELLGGPDLRQHRNALAALTTNATLTRDEGGHELFRRDLRGVSRILPLPVTVEDLSAFAAQPWRLVDSGLAEDDDLPWIVGVDLMEMLLEYFELPAIFLHFLTRRLRANRSRQLLALDEVDWAIRYGEDELLWAELPPDDPYARREFAVLEEHHEFSQWQLARQVGGRAKRPGPTSRAGRALCSASSTARGRRGGWISRWRCSTCRATRDPRW